jgi:hypothetical protein
MGQTELKRLLSRYVAEPKDMATTTYDDLYAELGQACPVEISGLPGEIAVGFLPEKDFACWQILTPDEIRNPTLPRPSDAFLGLPIVHCFDNTYLVVGSDGAVQMWDAVSNVTWNRWASVASALEEHLGV